MLHAQAAYLYRSRENIQDKIRLHKEYGTKNNFRTISNFTELRSKITLKIEKNGVTAKIKNFYNPLIEVLEKTNKNIEKEIIMANTCIDNLNFQYERTFKNIRNLRKKHKNMIKEKVNNALYIDIYSIAESFYNKPKKELEEKLTSELKEGIERIPYIFEEFLEEFEKEMIALESQYNFYKEINFNMKDIKNNEFDWKKIVKGTSFVVGIVSGILTILGAMSGPIVIVIGIFTMAMGFLADKLKSKDYKIKELQNKLNENYNKIKLEVEKEVEKGYSEIYENIEKNLKLFSNYNIEYKNIMNLIQDRNEDLVKIKNIILKQKEYKLDQEEK